MTNVTIRRIKKQTKGGAQFLAGKNPKKDRAQPQQTEGPKKKGITRPSDETVRKRGAKRRVKKGKGGGYPKSGTDESIICEQHSQVQKAEGQKMKRPGELTTKRRRKKGARLSEGRGRGKKTRRSVLQVRDLKIKKKKKW